MARSVKTCCPFEPRTSSAHAQDCARLALSHAVHVQCAGYLFSAGQCDAFIPRFINPTYLFGTTGAIFSNRQLPVRA